METLEFGAINPSLNNLIANQNKAAGVFTTVDAGGGADYTTIEAAAAGGAKTIFIKAGTYNLANTITLNNQSLIGESQKKTIINTGDNAINFQTQTVIAINGTLTLTNGSPNVAGVASNFNTANPSTNLWLLVGTKALKVLSITDATNLVLTESYNGITEAGMSYILLSGMSTGEEIRNITINHTATGLSNCITLSGAHVKIIDTAIYGNQFSDSLITLSGTINALISNCKTEGGAKGVSMAANKGAGTIIENCNSVNHTAEAYNIIGDGIKIINNNVSPANDIKITSSFDVLISGNTLHGGNATRAIYIDQCTEVRISNNTISTVTSSAIELNQSKATISGNIITAAGTYGIFVNGGSETRIIGNEIIGGTRSIHSTGVEIVISDNTIKNTATAGISTTGANTTINNNTLVGATVTGINVTGNESNISNNSIKSTTSKGINASGSYITINGNTVTGGTGSGIWAETGLYITTSGNVVKGFVDAITCRSEQSSITGNMCKTNTGTGIDVRKYVAVTGNTCFNNGTGIKCSDESLLVGNISKSNTRGIQNTGDNVVIVGNQTTNNGTDGIWNVNTADRANISGNISLNNTLNNILDNGTNTEIAGANITV